MWESNPSTCKQRRWFPYVVHKSSQSSFSTVIQLSLELGLNLQKRDIWLLLQLVPEKHNSNNFTEGYLPVSNGGTGLNLFNCRVDAFVLQLLVSQILIYISYPLQVHTMKECEWRNQSLQLKYCGDFKHESGHLWTSVRVNKGIHQMVFH